MACSADEFRARMKERWRGADPDQERKVVRAALWHFSCRLTGPETRHIEDRLPSELREYWPTPEPGPVRGEMRSVARIEFDEFVDRVRHDAHLPTRSEAESAARAVLHALGGCLDREERMHLFTQLPRSFQVVLEQELP